MMALFTALSWTSTRHVGVTFDEYFDHQSTAALVRDPLHGSGIDASQTRLPMYLTAGVYAVAKPDALDTFDGRTLLLARGVSIAVGALTILVAFFAARDWFGPNVGILAAATLAISPFHIAFSRHAFTDGDAFCPLFFVLTLWTYSRYMRNRNAGNMLTAAVSLGLMVAAKFLLVIIIPALLLCDVLAWWGSRDPRRREQSAATDWRIIVLAILSGVVGFATGGLTQLADKGTLAIDSNWLIASWAAGLLATTITCTLLFRSREVPWGMIAGWCALLPLSGAIFLLCFPEHVLHPEILRTLLLRSATWDNAPPFITARPKIRLYTGLVLFKLGLPLGLMLITAIFWSIARSWRNQHTRLMLLASAVYMLLVVATPVIQTFYLMAIYPLLVVLLAAWIMHATGWLQGRARQAWIAVTAAAYLWLIIGVVRVYPEYGYYGYETIGDEWWGQSTRGHLDIVVVSEDGQKDAIAWAIENVPEGKTVVSLLRISGQANDQIAATPHRFRWIQTDWFWTQPRDQVPGMVAQADYLIMHWNNFRYDRFTPRREELARDFETTPVHTVYRGRGIYRLPVVEVFKRRADRPPAPPTVDKPSKP